MIGCCFALLLMTACVNGQIPQRAEAFIGKNFPGCSAVLVEVGEEDDEPELRVWLTDGTRIEFDMQGEWRRVARKKSGVPQKLLPAPIVEYVKANYPNDVVTKFSKKAYGFKLELSDDIDLRFDTQGQFLEVVD